jgi:hypothetical protein
MHKKYQFIKKPARKYFSFCFSFPHQQPTVAPPPPSRENTLACGRGGGGRQFGRRDRHSGTLDIQLYNPSTI